VVGYKFNGEFFILGLMEILIFFIDTIYYCVCILSYTQPVLTVLFMLAVTFNSLFLPTLSLHTHAHLI